MTTTPQKFIGLAVIALVISLIGPGGAQGSHHNPPKPSKAQVCEAAKLEGVGEKAECLANEAADQVLGKTPNFAKCDREFTKAFTKAEAKAGAGVCPTEGDAAAIEARIDACVADIAAALSGSPPPTCSQFPATGQTTCWDPADTTTPIDTIACAGTGQDGDIKAGAALSYTDNLDGTITDNNTGLMWEKLCDEDPPGTTCPAEHDVDTTYTWANAFAVKIAALNTVPCFAGYCDWRLPNVKELQSIVNYENINPAVSPAFNTGCVASCSVTTCSCTQASYYWSSTSYALGPASAWVVLFLDGFELAGTKSNPFFVRALRGGL